MIIFLVFFFIKEIAIVKVWMVENVWNGCNLDKVCMVYIEDSFWCNWVEVF